jgi:23S rRNA (uracil1939-C5)-methyltransferase
MPTVSLQLTVSGFTTAGDAVAVGEGGRRIYVKGAIPGETVLVDLKRVGQYFSGQLISVVEEGADRVVPPCPAFALGCGGCQWQYIEPAAQLRYKEQVVLDALRRHSGRDVPVPIRSVQLGAWAYRTSLRCGTVDGEVTFRQRRSQSAVAARGCLVAHPLLLELLEGARYPGAAEVLLRCGAVTGERLVSVTPESAAIDVPADVFRRHYHETVAGKTWRISATSFFQGRPDGAEALAAIVRQSAADMGQPGRAIDLYSGVGLFAGVLAEAGWKVVAVERNQAAVGDARANLAGADVRVIGASVSRWKPSHAELVVADPSRSGLGRAGVAAIVGAKPARLVLVSCDADALGRDTAMLARHGFEMTSLTQVEMFPHTFRVELVAVFDRSA